MLGSLALFLGHCSRQEQADDGPKTAASAPAEASEEAAIPVEKDRVRTKDDLPPNDRVLVMIEPPGGGERQESWLRRSEAIRAGYTIVDLSDDWTPYIFAEQDDATGKHLYNRYRRVFIGLANDELDSDGVPLEAGQKNYLELFGIFPSLSVLRERFLRSEKESCMPSTAEGAALAAVDDVPTLTVAQMKKNAAQHERLAKELEAERRKAGADSLATLAKKRPKLASKVETLERFEKQKAAFAEVEKRLACEGLLKFAEPGKKPNAELHARGLYDDAMRAAVRTFQQKNMIYEGSHAIRKKTMVALTRPALANDYESLVRALRERVVAAAGVIEDGSTDGKNGPPKYTSASGEKRPVPNLAEEYTKHVVEQLGITTPEQALAFMKRYPAEDFKRFLVGVKLPPRPEYYSDHMELSIVIDRGDVWYDPPFDEEGKWHAQPRSRYPTLTLLLDYRGEQIPLARWRTTIGGWRSEQASDGYEYYKYKGSDVGPRVMRHIISGPVWIAPESTPIRSLVKTKVIDGVSQSVVNYDELGPGYTSAYGLVAGYLVIPGENGRPDGDRGIRIHGSSNYLSIYNPEGYSHGCHRLPNHLAIRLYDFLLQHRKMKVLGDAPMNFWRQFLAYNHVFEIRIPSRGYVYELDPPLPVNVLAGRRRGKLTSPVVGYVQKPGVRYPGPPPDQIPEGTEDKAGAGAPLADNTPVGGTL